ncbi:DUF2630 family protein [Flexivirga sp. ID2601S]|uniref:DUF2630 family protein n=1 Tax=Flexivirga aerilata TaxID=1656889 RepID=A0A849APZ5_9MICO|nr:DUF2630 family protein [Flexivirga aerilata]NNG38852.1 DUF2630 family protein [Flexivirga aerilata]
MNDRSIHDHINDLVATEKSLRQQLADGKISAPEEQERLRSVEAELDRLWDLLRQRDAKREFPDAAPQPEERSASTVENYLD